MLNRIVSINEYDVTYELDPRHVELLGRYLGLEIRVSSAAAPGVNMSYGGELEEDNPDDVHDALSLVREARKTCARVRFNESPAYLDPPHRPHHIPTQSLLYGPIGTWGVRPVQRGRCIFTGPTHEELKANKH